MGRQHARGPPAHHGGRAALPDPHGEGHARRVGRAAGPHRRAGAVEPGDRDRGRGQSGCAGHRRRGCAWPWPTRWSSGASRRHRRAAALPVLRRAPLPVEAGEFLAAAGVPVIEGYGMTEAAPVLAMNRLGRQRLGTVGPPVAGTELRIEAETVRSWPAGRRSCRATTTFRGRRPPRLRPTAGCGPATWAPGTRRATCGSPACARTCWCWRQARRSARARWRRSCEGSDLIARAAVVDLGADGVGRAGLARWRQHRSRAALDGETEQGAAGRRGQATARRPCLVRAAAAAGHPAARPER